MNTTFGMFSKYYILLNLYYILKIDRKKNNISNKKKKNVYTHQLAYKRDGFKYHLLMKIIGFFLAFTFFSPYGYEIKRMTISKKLNEKKKKCILYLIIIMRVSYHR